MKKKSLKTLKSKSNSEIEDPLNPKDALDKNVIWIAYPDISDRKTIRFVCGSGQIIYYISLKHGIQFLKEPWDDRTIYFKFHNDWLNDERLFLIREKERALFKKGQKYFDTAYPEELDDNTP